MTLLSNVTLRKHIITDLSDDAHHEWQTDNIHYSYGDNGQVIVHVPTPTHPIVIENMQPEAIQPCSVDVYVSDDPPKLLTSSKIVSGAFYQAEYHSLCPRYDGHDAYYVLVPDRLYLMSTHEYFRIPVDLCGQLRGVSTNGRVGFIPHKEAGLLDPGWEGRITLEAEVKIRTYFYPMFRGKRFRAAQVVFETLDCPADPPYRGRYQGDRTAQPPKVLKSIPT